MAKRLYELLLSRELGCPSCGIVLGSCFVVGQHLTTTVAARISWRKSKTIETKHGLAPEYQNGRTEVESHQLASLESPLSCFLAIFFKFSEFIPTIGFTWTPPRMPCSPGRTLLDRPRGQGAWLRPSCGRPGTCPSLQNVNVFWGSEGRREGGTGEIESSEQRT